MHKYVTEFIGTFFLVFTIGMATSREVGAGPIAPLAIGAVLMVMVYMGGHISGAQYNPAVSLAVLLRGKMGLLDFAIYVIAQILGAMLAATAVYGILGHAFALAPGPVAKIWTALLVEILFTFALALVVLNVATAKKTEGNSYFGLAIGFTVAAGAFSVGNVSGGAFNPAVGTGPIVMHAILDGGTLEHLWIYLVGPLAGGAIAALVFRVQEAGTNAGS